MDFTENRSWERFKFNRVYTALWILHETPPPPLRSRNLHTALKLCPNRQRDTNETDLNLCAELYTGPPLLRLCSLAFGHPRSNKPWNTILERLLCILHHLGHFFWKCSTFSNFGSPGLASLAPTPPRSLRSQTSKLHDWREKKRNICRTSTRKADEE